MQHPGCHLLARSDFASNDDMGMRYGRKLNFLSDGLDFCGFTKKRIALVQNVSARFQFVA